MPWAVFECQHAAGSIERSDDAEEHAEPQGEKRVSALRDCHNRENDRTDDIGKEVEPAHIARGLQLPFARIIHEGVVEDGR